MLSLGVNIGHDRGAALVRDGEIVCAVSLERLDRNKHSIGVLLPYQAMEYCLNAGNCKYTDLDVLVFNYPHHNNAYPVLDTVKQELRSLCDNVVFVPHHIAHAYSVFYASAFKEAVVFICDGAGNRFDLDTEDFYKNWLWNISARPGEIEAESAYYFDKTPQKLIYKRWQTRTGPNQKLSLGRMYWEACLHVGMGILDGGKLMGLAPYGEKLIQAKNIVKRDGGDFHIDVNDIKRLPSGSFDDNAKAAWVIQNSLEETLVWLANLMYQKSPCQNICISGGVGLNSVSNERILRESPFENIFIAPASNDSGVPLGCAYFGYYHILKGRQRRPYKVYTGRAYDDSSIVEALQANVDKVSYHVSGDMSKEIAKLIADGNIIGWFQGASEYGPRALGNRSILCDPRSKYMKDVLNNKVKHRENYRPFAPAVMFDQAHKYFDIKSECPYMLQIVGVLEEKKDNLAAITHVDGTARVQTLRYSQNPKFYNLIKAFGELTGVPVVLNTSFNVAGEPIVETPSDALRCFLSTNIDVLVMGDFIVQKKTVPKPSEPLVTPSGRVQKKVLLATSAAPAEAPFSTGEKRPPMGIGFLISVLRDAGHEVFFIDNYLQPSDFLETDYLRKNEIDYVGIYINTICFRDGLRMIKALDTLRKQGRWAGKIIVGGPHTTVAPETIPDCVDFVVQGEGEKAIVDIVEGRVKERIVRYPRIENLDELPQPAWDCFVGQPYNWRMRFIEDAPVFTMNTSRGCPFKCQFCSVGSVWGKKYTYFSAERIVDEIEMLIDNYGARGIYFREDNFTLNKERLEKFCSLIIERGINISWVCESRVSNLDRDTIALMAGAGLKGFYFGVESGSQRMLDLMEKGITVEQIRNVFRWCRELNVKTAASLIVGVPGETGKDLAQTQKLIDEIRPDTTWANVFVGIPDSKLYKATIDNRLYEYIDDRGLVYLQGHDKRVTHYYGTGFKGYIPREEHRKDMTSRPKVSILMAAYNAERFIEQALQSIYDQNFQDFEVVIVDDCSTDATADILLKMKDSRTAIYRNATNQGLTKSLNAGIKLCRGDYIARMDADDISHPGRFEKQVRFLDDNPDCIAVGSWYERIDENGRVWAKRENPTDCDDIKNELLIGNCIGHSTAMVRRRELVTVGGYNEAYQYAQDYDLWLRLTERGSVHNLPDYLCQLRTWGGAISTDKIEQQMRFVDRALADAIKRRGRDNLVSISLLNNFCARSLQLFEQGQCLGCVVTLGHAEMIKPDIAKRFRNFDLLRAIGLLALGARQRSKTFAETELRDHGSKAASEFISHCLQAKANVDVHRWYAEACKRYSLLPSDTCDEVSTLEQSPCDAALGSGSERPGQSHVKSKEKPLVSVIMPAYNDEKYIADAIKSVLAQTYDNFELVIINDGSTDGTEDIIHGLGNERIRYFCQANRGLAATHNEGIRRAFGVLLTKLDSDDMMTPDFIERHVKEFAEYPDADLVYCDDQLIRENSDPIRIIKRPEYTDRRLLIRDLFGNGFPVIPFRTCIRKRVFEKIGLFDEDLRMAEDYDMMRRFIKAGLKAHHLREALYLRRMAEDSLSRRYTEEKARIHFSVWRKYLDTFSCDELFPDVRWDDIRPEYRDMHAKCLAAAICIRMGQTYVETNIPLYASVAIENASGQIKDCLGPVENNQQIKQLLGRCEQIRQKLCGTCLVNA